MKNQFLDALSNSQTVLLAGAGGGYDVFCGLPIYFWLKKLGKTVHLANLSSGALGFCDAENPARVLWKITPTTSASNYFPEMHLASWLSEHFGDTSIYSILPSGARHVSAAYQWLERALRPDCVVLVDGGTDSLMFGDEAGLATPEGDAVSLYAASQLNGTAHKYLVCLGFGVDSHHGICHAHFLENVAKLSRQDAYFGAWSLGPHSEEFQLYKDACDFVFARLPQQPSIVNSSVIAAANGHFGNWHATARTEGSTLFINPLMAMFWAFDLHCVAQQNLYLQRIADTETIEEAALIIETFRASLSHIRPWSSIPC